MRPLTMRQAQALFAPSISPAELDAHCAEQWHKGVLSPRQSAGFYEADPASFAERMRRYRASITAIDRYARWRRAHPQPVDSHWVTFERKRKREGKVWVIRDIISGVMREPPPEYEAWRQAKHAYDAMSKRERAKAGITEPVAPPVQKHDRWMISYGQVKSVCPGCEAYGKVNTAWRDARAAALARLVDLDVSERDVWVGNDPARWPDGSWNVDILKYDPLPIRSARVVKRVRPKAA